MFKFPEPKTVPGKPGRKEFIRYDNLNLALLLLHLRPNLCRDMRTAAHIITTIDNLERKLKVHPVSLREEVSSLNVRHLPHLFAWHRCALIASHERVLASSVHCEVRYDGNKSLILFWQSLWREKYDKQVMPLCEAWKHHAKEKRTK
jgi:hypothetical protein